MKTIAKLPLIALIVALNGCAAHVIEVPPTQFYPNNSATNAIVFIHGLNGDPVGT